MDILLNPVVISVVIMVILCLLKLNVFISLVVSSIICGLIGGYPLVEVINVLISGMGGNNEIVFSLILFGVLAAAMTKSGVGDVLVPKVSKLIGNKSWILLVVLAGMAVLSETFILIYVAFVPIIVPPLLPLMNELEMDRRKVATAIVGGLKISYIMIPAGYGLIYHQIIQGELALNGLDVSLNLIWKSASVAGLAMIVGFIISLYFYRKPRKYNKMTTHETNASQENLKMKWSHWATLIGALAAVGIQLTTGSMPLGALCGVLLMAILGAIKWKDFDETTLDGIKIFGFIAFVMMAASGFSEIAREMGNVQGLIDSTLDILGGNMFFGAILMLTLGLIITMGIGTSFGTIPIVAAVIVPMGMQLGFSPAAIILLVAISAALGDAGSPASDSTLVPSAALNVDGQHDHIWDTCVPTFIFYNIPLIIFGIIGSLIL